MAEMDGQTSEATKNIGNFGGASATTSTTTTKKKGKRRKKDRINNNNSNNNNDGDGGDGATSQKNPTNLQLPQPTPPMPPKPPLPRKLLIISIGNPPPHTHTLHSTAHTLLTHLARTLSYPPFQRSSLFRSDDGLIARPPAGTDHPPWTFWQSGSAMNGSGRGVRGAWEGWVREEAAAAAAAAGEAGLVVVHDELDLAFGRVRVRDGMGSARGHRGVRSVLEEFGARGVGAGFVRVAVGIGRPGGGSRERGDVAAYVLRGMTEGERRRVEEEAAPAVLRALREMVVSSS